MLLPEMLLHPTGVTTSRLRAVPGSLADIIILGDIINICKPFSPHHFWNRAGRFGMQSWFWLEQGDLWRSAAPGPACCLLLPAAFGWKSAELLGFLQAGT